MAYLSVPTRGSLFQNDKVSQKLSNWKKVSDIKRALKEEEYNNRQLRKSLLDDGDHVILNVGGSVFKTRKATLRNVPRTKLSALDENSEHFNNVIGEYFFDRNPFLFGYILDYYRTGTMHLPSQLCSTLVREELKFWDLGDGCISECCRKPYFDALDQNTTYELIKAEFYSLPTYTESETPNTTINSRWQEFKTWAWVFIDNHESSLAAKIFAVIYYGLIVLTIINLFVSTLPEIREPLRKHVLIRSPDDIVPIFNYTMTLSNTTTIYHLLTTDPPDVLVIIDIICLLFFTAEFIFRLVVCPSLRERFRSWYTVLDVLYLMPAWTRLIIDVGHPFYWQQGFSEASFLVFLDAMLILRVFRIFRISRHYRGLRVLLLAFKASIGELMLLIVFVMLTLIIFASLVYCAEQYQDPNGFESIFKGLWWSLITLTTVGYGDTVPTGTIGRIIASFCAVTGLLIIGMVIPIIAGNFHLYYGFRHAGVEDFELFKPEFMPSEKENPVPDLEIDTFAPINRRASLLPSESRLRTTSLRTASSRQLRPHTLQNGKQSSTDMLNKRAIVRSPTCPPRRFNAFENEPEMNSVYETVNTKSSAV